MKMQKSRNLLERDKSVLASGQHLFYYPLAVERVEGEIVTDLDGNRYIDFLSSASSLNLGGSCPQLVQSVRAQMEKCMQYCTCYTTNEPMVEYAERLTSVYPGGRAAKIFFTHCGSDACDAAMRFARVYTGREKIISFTHSCHGSTYAAAGLSACYAAENEPINLLLPDIRYFRYYYEDECFPEDYPYLAELEQAFATDLPPEQVAAIFVEPIQGDGGLRPASKAFLQQLQALCRKHGILFISDEVQQGFFRSGRWFGIERYDLIPDGIVLGKSLGAGLPLGAFMASPDVMDTLPTSVCACTLAGFHLACAAGIAQFDTMRQDTFQKTLRENSALMARLVQKLGQRQWKDILFKCLGVGMSYGIHVLHGETGAPDPQMAAKIACRCYERGLLLLAMSGNVLRLQPPLNIRAHHLCEGFRQLEAAIDDVLRGYEPNPMLLSQPAWQQDGEKSTWGKNAYGIYASTK